MNQSNGCTRVKNIAALSMIRYSCKPTECYNHTNKSITVFVSLIVSVKMEHHCRGASKIFDLALVYKDVRKN